MIEKERKRLAVLAQVKSGELKRSRRGGMGVTYRQAKRVVAAVSSGGRGRVVHRSRGRPSPRRKPVALTAGAGALHAAVSGFWADAGSGVSGGRGSAVESRDAARVVDRPGTRSVRGGAAASAGRERRACYGMMVQLDGSHHDWFEGRRVRRC